MYSISAEKSTDLFECVMRGSSRLISLGVITIGSLGDLAANHVIATIALRFGTGCFVKLYSGPRCLLIKLAAYPLRM